jgi:transcriptional regulator with XRE-family HTH domain
MATTNVAPSPMDRRQLSDNLQCGDPWFKRVAQRLRSARLAAGLKCRHLADEVGIRLEDVSNMERNVAPMKLIQLRAFSKMLGIPIQQFFDVDREDDTDLMPMPPGDEPWVWRVTARDEQRLIESYRALTRKERKTVHLMCKAVTRARDPNLGSIEERKAKMTERQQIAALQSKGYAVKPRKPGAAASQYVANTNFEMGPRGEEPGTKPKPKKIMPDPILAGQKYGRWTVLRKTEHSMGNLFDCICDCGTPKSVAAQALRNRMSMSCGCLRREMILERNRNRWDKYRADKAAMPAEPAQEVSAELEEAPEAEEEIEYPD